MRGVDRRADVLARRLSPRDQRLRRAWFTDELLAALRACGCRRVLVAFDRDAAGDAAAGELAPKLQAAGLDAFRLLFPKGMDANAYAQAVQPASRSLGVVIRSAQWHGDGVAPAIGTAERAAEADHETSDVDRPSRTDLAGGVADAVVGEGGGADRAAADGVAGGAASIALPASAVPAAPDADPAAEASEREMVMTFGERRYRVRGHAKNTSFEVMKVNVLVAQGEALHVDTVDLHSTKHRQAFARAAASELGVEEAAIQRDLGKLLLKLEQLQEARVAEAMKPKLPMAVAMSGADHAAALALLAAPDLIARVRADVERVGVVGEGANALVGYLACVSRKLGAPLAVIIQSTSAAGKSTLMDALLSLVPDEDRVHYSAMTGQSLFYLGETSVKHKVLAIAEEEGVRQAAYALKVLQSQGELTIASTGKDPATGMLVTQEYRVEGPVMLFLTTTAIDIDEELLNRCLVLTKVASAMRGAARRVSRFAHRRTCRQRWCRCAAGGSGGCHSRWPTCSMRACPRSWWHRV